jgi:glutamyl-Q tRNA(Asp) synthetase
MLRDFPQGVVQISYRGRFAPSPTGPLHFGSLVAAVGSYLDARSQGGEWLVRMEDVDTPRVVPGAADSILRTLEAFGFEWNGPVLYQSTREEAYEAALEHLRGNRAVFGCGCSRKDVPGRYPGTCRDRTGLETRSWRLRVASEPISFEDRLLGTQIECLEETCGDFVLKRADGLYAYQLAVVVDDAAQGISDVVRGADLLDSTARQIWLQRCLGFPTPRYAHLPLVLGPDGQKLSKQTLAPPVEAGSGDAVRQLLDAYKFLCPSAEGEPPATIAEFWQWAIADWRIERVQPRDVT